ncbi:MAG: ATP-binding protein [Bacteroidales bacterium]|nr:ATP-binding protein [Bacteroidales bacterium]
MRRFNTTGTCYPEEHYMVDITKRLDDIVNRVADGEYITINRGRQYGKTTTLYHLAQRLKNDYVVFSISFEKFGKTEFSSEDALAYHFVNSLYKKIRNIKALNESVKNILQKIVADNSQRESIKFDSLSDCIIDICEQSDKPVVLIIDEVDSASNYESFIKLLRMFREKYLNRKESPTFKSVILAGVYDIKNLKLKVRPDSDHQYNSPWNIAVPFRADMALHKDGIAQMLQDYEDDHHTGMNVSEMAQMVWDYSSGYPFFVSRLCQIIAEENFEWNKEGFLKAVNILLTEDNTFFDDLIKKLNDFPQMYKMLKDILHHGTAYPFNSDDKVISISKMFNYIANDNGKIRVSNRIIETRLYNFFMVEELMQSRIYREGQIDRSQFIEGNTLKMDKIIEKFAQHFNDIYGDRGDKFCEDEGRRYFMLYVKPIINGTGNYYIEAQTRDLSRTDMIIDYLGTQYIIEMKIWRGDAYNERGEQQLTEYLDYYHVNKGYMLSFCFNQKKETGIVKRLKFGDKEIVEVVV